MYGETELETETAERVAHELNSFWPQLRRRAPLPGTTLERAFRVIEAVGGIRFAATRTGRTALNGLSAAFEACARYHAGQIGRGGDWHQRWIEHCEERCRRIAAFCALSRRTSAGSGAI